MALKATIYKLSLQVTDMDRAYYHGHELIIARHPSETERRMMLRILLFAMHAHERLRFTRGVSTVDEPDLWRHDEAGIPECWIELGQPDERRIRHALSRFRQVYVYTCGGQAADVWWDRMGGRLAEMERLTVADIPAASADSLVSLCGKNMALHCLIQDGELWLGDARREVHVRPVPRMSRMQASS